MAPATWNSLDQTLPHGVDEVGVGRHLAALTDRGRDLCSMIGAVHCDVGEDISYGVGPVLAQAVPVANSLREARAAECLQVPRPVLRQPVDADGAPVQVQLRPD